MLPPQQAATAASLPRFRYPPIDGLCRVCYRGGIFLFFGGR